MRRKKEWGKRNQSLRGGIKGGGVGTSEVEYVEKGIKKIFYGEKEKGGEGG